MAGQNISVKDGDGEKGNPVTGTADPVTFKNAEIETLTLKTLSGKDAIKEYNIAKGAIHNLLMAKNSTHIDKLRSGGHSCFVVGSDADHQYHELTYGGRDLLLL